jgi:hypothetical protein
MLIQKEFPLSLTLSRQGRGNVEGNLSRRKKGIVMETL